MINDPIVALTGYHTQAINIVRLSGEHLKELVQSILKYDVMKQLSHTIKHNYVLDDGVIVDEVMVSYFQSPKSYTGQDMIEINIHGSLLIGNRIVAMLIAKGARLALAGEFTQRAYLARRIDLTQAEAINDLIHARTSYQSAQAMQGVCGAVTACIRPLMAEILECLANIEVNIDYPEYDDVEVMSDHVVLPLVNKWLIQLQTMIVASEKNILLKEGIVTAIIGEPNVGKSSLLNALIAQDKAIVSNIPGTTRDYVEGEVVINQIHLKLMDTAGLRVSDDVIEQMGINKTKELIEVASLVLMVVDASKQLSEYELTWLDVLKEKRHLVVYNKSDLIEKKSGVCISAINNDIQALLTAVADLLAVDTLEDDVSTVNNQRQLGLLKQGEITLTQALTSLKEQQPLDVVAIDIHHSYQCLADILGEYHRADLLTSIFSNFCLGK